MKKYYIVNRVYQKGRYEVRSEDCPFLTLMITKKYLGEFDSCEAAHVEARKRYNNVNGCEICCLKKDC